MVNSKLPLPSLNRECYCVLWYSGQQVLISLPLCQEPG